MRLPTTAIALAIVVLAARFTSASSVSFVQESSVFEDEKLRTNGEGSVVGHSIARVWDEQILSAIRIDTPHPPVHARNLFHLSVAMYDAWAAYDKLASGCMVQVKASAVDTPISTPSS